MPKRRENQISVKSKILWPDLVTHKSYSEETKIFLLNFLAECSFPTDLALFRYRSSPNGLVLTHASSSSGALNPAPHSKAAYLVNWRNKKVTQNKKNDIQPTSIYILFFLQLAAIFHILFGQGQG